MSFGIWELLIILAVVLLIFGPKRIKTIGADLGNAIKGFRKAVSEDDPPAKPGEAKVIEGEAEAASGPTHEVHQDSKA